MGDRQSARRFCVQRNRLLDLWAVDLATQRQIAHCLPLWMWRPLIRPLWMMSRLIGSTQIASLLERIPAGSRGRSGISIEMPGSHLRESQQDTVKRLIFKVSWVLRSIVFKCLCTITERKFSIQTKRFVKLEMGAQLECNQFPVPKSTQTKDGATSTTTIDNTALAVCMWQSKSNRIKSSRPTRIATNVETITKQRARLWLIISLC